MATPPRKKPNLPQTPPPLPRLEKLVPRIVPTVSSTGTPACAGCSAAKVHATIQNYPTWDVPSVSLSPRRHQNLHSQEWLCCIMRTMTYYERNLPHWHPDGRKIFLTWRLYGSLPDDVIASLHKSDAPASKKFLRAERFLDQSEFGPLWLREPQVASAVEASILHGAQPLNQYRLLAYAVMPNHVHLLIEPKAPLAKITLGIKGTTAHQSNRLLGRTGKTFWQGESFDHWVRNETEEAKIRQYIENNPVKARLCAGPADWKWSSAARK